jgi:hypothetical protein
MSKTNSPKSFRFSDEELALLERMALRFGGPKAAIMAGLAELEGKVEPSDDELLKLIRERMSKTRRK